MAKKILQINFRYNMSNDAYLKDSMDSAQLFADMKGLEWKIWLLDPEKKMAGGIYLFKDMESVQAYLKGEIVAAAMKDPTLSDIDVKVFDVLPGPSKITRAPI